MDSGIDIRVGGGVGDGGPGARPMNSVEYSSLLRHANNISSEVEMRKRYKSLKKTVTFFLAVGAPHCICLALVGYHLRMGLVMI